ncbi:Serine/threonine-protein kinase pim-2 [Aphelenchoides bicaudatus]|nr:Serine/threonine-protein kinase pim-2 [Aphelenchoides bicaudatus]
MTLTDLVKKLKFTATRHLLTLKSAIKGRGFEKFKKQYVFEEIIGTGGFGVVYAGFKLSNYQPVAIKFIERRQIIEWAKLDDERVPMEICMLKRCERVSGVIDLLEWFTVPDGFLIVMERPMVSIDLYCFITKNGHLNENISRFLFRQLVESTSEIMNVCKVIHRDIKNENIVIDLVTGHIKLVDFGAATYLKANKYHSFQGTRLYSPPEWFSHSVYLGLEATVWSIGVVLYSMLNGQLPYLNASDICTKHLLGPLPKFINYSDSAEDLIQKCLCYEPFRRIKLDKIRKHTWYTQPINSTWDEMVTDLLQQNDSSPKTTHSTSQGTRKESGVNTSTQIEQPSRQNASNDEQPKSRQQETEAMISNRRMSLKNQANTCILQLQKQNHRERIKSKFVRSKTAKIISAKLRNRAGSSDSGNQSCSQSPLTSPIFSATNKFIL